MIKTKKKGDLRKSHFGWIFVSPWVFGFLCFTLVPLLVSLYLSFTEWNGFGGIQSAEWVGLKNYINLFNKETKYGESFYAGLSNTLIYTLMAIVVNIVVGISVAWSIAKAGTLNSALRTIIYMPAMTISTAFAIMMDTIFGVKSQSLINRLLVMLGGESQAWLSTPGQAVWVMVLLFFWGVGGAMLTYLSGIKNIDQNVYDAAKIDGANNMTLLLKICIPLISGVIVYQMIMGLVFGLQVFDLAVGLSSIVGAGDGAMGHGNSLATLVFYLYNKSFVDGEFGMGSAIGWVIFFISSVASIGLLAFVLKTGYYSLDD